MKKTISITISGIIFHIEEDGYDALRQYLNSIKHYFSGFDDHQEIIDDIEGRVAEIFLQRLKSGRQVIGTEDIRHLQETLGSVKDFSAVEEEAASSQASSSSASSFGAEPAPMDRLYRNTIGKVIGGVAGGLGVYFRADPVWFRILFLLLLVLPAFTPIPGAFSSIAFITYIVLWIVLPAKAIFRDQQPKNVKKLYREPDARVLGGVSGGLAKYFGMEVTVVRLVFVLLLIPFFLGFFIYIVLWMIVPQARTLTEKMEMEGEPVTLDNIEQSLKKSLQPAGKAEESTVTKIVLFPFRAVAAVIRFLGRVLKPLALILLVAIRLFAGLILFILGASLVIGVIGGGAYLLGLAPNAVQVSDLEMGVLNYISENISVWMYIGVFSMICIPGIALMISGISIIANKNLWNKWIGFGMLGLWFAGVILVAVLGATGDYNFQERTPGFTQRLEINQVPILKLDASSKEEIENYTVTIEGYEDEENTIKLVDRLDMILRGNESNNSIRSYRPDARIESDSILLLPLQMKIPEELGKVMRHRLTVSIPYNKPFVMDENLIWALRGTMTRSAYTTQDIQAGTVWVFDEEKGLLCVSCGDWLGPVEEE